MAELIQRLKYRDETHLAPLLGRLLHRRLTCSVSPHCILVPVPLHRARLAERGYNQAALIARALGRCSKMRVRTDLVRRIRCTSAQAGLAAVERRKNVHAAFAARPCNGHRIVLVDDVATTGATLRECILCLKRAGAIVEEVVTVALATGD